MHRRTFLTQAFISSTAAASTLLAGRSSSAAEQAPVDVDADFPGGNVDLVDIEGDTVELRPDLRDTEGFWFYWYFRVRGAAGRTLRFRFGNDRSIGARGPAISTDGGRIWRWQAEQFPAGPEFEHTFADDATDTRFAMTIPYVPANLEAFLEPYAEHPHLRRQTLCESPTGRPVPMLRLGELERPRFRALVTGRHHACETMASFAIEGMIAAMLADDATGRWLREHVELTVVPFTDHDGVALGDQGKNRRPRDHNRDYAGESIYPEVAAIRELVAGWGDEQPWVFMDMHCPYIRGGAYNENIYQVGRRGEATWAAQQRLGELVEAEQDRGLPYAQANDLPFGEAWNTQTNYDDGMPSSAYMAEQPGNRLSTTWEIPYATAGGAEVHIEPCRSFGRGLARALQQFIETELV